jgi:hypothetical protein
VELNHRGSKRFQQEAQSCHSAKARPTGQGGCIAPVLAAYTTDSFRV